METVCRPGSCAEEEEEPRRLQILHSRNAVEQKVRVHGRLELHPDEIIRTQRAAENADASLPQDLPNRRTSPTVLSRILPQLSDATLSRWDTQRRRRGTQRETPLGGHVSIERAIFSVPFTRLADMRLPARDDPLCQGALDELPWLCE